MPPQLPPFAVPGLGIPIDDQTFASPPPPVPFGPALEPAIEAPPLVQPAPALLDYEPAPPPPMPAELASIPSAPPAFAVPVAAPPPAPGTDPVIAARDLQVAGITDRTRSAYAPAHAATQTARDFDAAGEQLGRRWLDMQRQISQTTDPAARAKLVAQATDLETEARAVELGGKQARLDADVALATGDAEVEVAGQELALVRREQAAEQIRAEREKRNAELETLRQDRAAAAKKVQERRDSAAQLLHAQAAGDSTTTWSSVGALIGELTSAFAQRRQPNLDGAISTVLELGRERLAAQRAAAGAEVETAEEGAAAIDRSIVDIEAEGAAADAAILDQAQQALDQELLKARGTPREVALFRAQEAVRTARARAEAEATAKQTEATSKQRQGEAEITLKMAQARKAEAEAARLGRRGIGGGAGGAAGSGTLAPNIVTLPGTNEIVAQFPNTAQGRKRAYDAALLVSAQSETLRLLNEYQALLEDYGTRGLFDDKDFARTDEFSDIETARQAIVGPLAKIYAGGFNPSIEMEKRAERSVSLPAGWWQKSGVATASLKRLQHQAEEGFREKAGPVGLSPEAVEKVIAFRRKRGESERDLKDKLSKNAEKVLVDAAQDPKVRISAINALVERHKTQTGKGETGKAWVNGALLTLQRVQAQMPKDADPQVRAALDKKVEELAEDWRKVGSAGQLRTNEEQARSQAAEREAEFEAVREFPRSIR